MTPAELMFKPGLMKGQRILITGGGTGLGKAMAEACLILGAEVFICGRRGGVVEATANALNDAHATASGGRVVGLACDIRVPEAITDMIDQVWAGGALTGLVNNAAGNFISRTKDLSPRGFDAIANIVFRGSFFVTLDCGKRWLAEGTQHRSVISILTTWVWNGSPFVVPSAMSKAGLNAMTQSLAVEWAPAGVRFNAIAPGPFPTEGMSARLNPGENAYGDMRSNPMGRVGKMEELANLVVYLLDPGSAYVNGQTIAIDGGAYLATGGNFSGLSAWSDAQWQAARDAIQATNAKDRAARTV